MTVAFICVYTVHVVLICSDYGHMNNTNYTMADGISFNNHTITCNDVGHVHSQ